MHLRFPILLLAVFLTACQPSAPPIFELEVPSYEASKALYDQLAIDQLNPATQEIDIDLDSTEIVGAKNLVLSNLDIENGVREKWCIVARYLWFAQAVDGGYKDYVYFVENQGNNWQAKRVLVLIAPETHEANTLASWEACLAESIDRPGFQ